MDANHPRRTLEAPRRHKGTNLEAPKPGPLHNHAPALNDADFDTSKYATGNYAKIDYARAEYSPKTNASSAYNRTDYRPTSLPAPTPAPAPVMSPAEARRADPHSWRNDPPISATSTGPSAADTLRDGRAASRYSRGNKSSGLDPMAPRRTNARDTLSGTTRNAGSAPRPGEPQTWQDAFAEITSDPIAGKPLKIVALLFGLLVVISMGVAIFHDFFWMALIFICFNLFKVADDDTAWGGAVSKLKSFLATFSPALSTSVGLRIATALLGVLSIFMVFAP